MANMFSNLKTDDLEEQQDRLGGGDYTLDTGIYPAVVKYAYAQPSATSKSVGIVVSFEVTKEDGSTQEYRETFWVVNKKGENRYEDKKDKGKFHPIPGFAMVDALCFLTTGKGLTDQEMEERTWSVYDREQKKELPQEKPTLIDVCGKEIGLAIFKDLINGQEKDSENNYADVAGKDRTVNQIEKMFDPETGRTLTEIRQDIEEATFIPKWKDKNEGKPPRDRRSIKSDEPTAGAGTGSPKGGAPVSNRGDKPRTSLFGGKK